MARENSRRQAREWLRDSQRGNFYKLESHFIEICFYYF